MNYSIADYIIQCNSVNNPPEIQRANKLVVRIMVRYYSTVNIYLAMKEFNDRKKMTFDQWKDVANDVIELNMLCNTLLRDDQIVYIMGHTMLQTQNDGTEKTVFSVIGKKLTKTQPEGFYPMVLMTRVEYGDDGENEYYFQTKANHSSAKTPLGLFDKFEIPNSLKLVDDAVRNYYKI